MKKMTNDVYLMKRLLSKEEQEKLAWLWVEDYGLQLIYKDFNAFVTSRVGPYTTKHNEALDGRS